MDPRLPRVRTLALAREELRALPRQTFALGAVAAVLGLFAPIAAFTLEGHNALRDMLVFTWLVAELCVAIAVAARVASARRSRFVDSLYTTPLEARTWLAAQALVGLALAALVLLAPAPFVLVHVLHVGAPAVLPALLLGAVCMGVFAVALGLFCGVVVGNAGPGAASGLAGGIGFLSFVLLIVHGFAVTSPPSPAQPLLLRLSALSPLTLATDGMGILIFRAAPEAAWRPLVGLAALVAGLGAAAWVAYVRAQGPLGWEPRGSRGLVAALVALAVLAPVATAAVAFRETGDENDFVFVNGERTQVALVPRGAPIADEAFRWRAIMERDALTLGETQALDVLVLVLAPDDAALRNVRIDVRGSDSLEVVDGGALVAPTGAPEGHARPSEGFEDESTGAPRPVYRVPVTLRPVEVTSLRGSPSILSVDASFVVDGRAYASHARTTVDVEVPHASTQLLLAGLPLPVAALAALVTRKLRTR